MEDDSYFLFAAAIAVMHGMASQNACESDTLEYNKNGVRHHGALRVEAARLVNHAGEAVQLRGMSSHGLQWYRACHHERIWSKPIPGGDVCRQQPGRVQSG